MAENAACGSDVSSFPGDAICKVCQHLARDHAKWKAVGGRGERQTVADEPERLPEPHPMIPPPNPDLDANYEAVLRAIPRNPPPPAWGPGSGLDGTRSCHLCGYAEKQSKMVDLADGRWACPAHVSPKFEPLTQRSTLLDRLRARKDDAGKPRWSLLFRDFRGALALVVKVREHGIEKYGEIDSWKNVPNARERYREALGRHVAAILAGEEIDAAEDGGSDLPHLAHVIINALFLLWFREQDGAW